MMCAMPTVSAFGQNVTATEKSQTVNSGESTVRIENYADSVTREIVNSMIFVEGGTFTMGCTSEQGGDCNKNEKPAHSVTVNSFYIGMYEITQAQWRAIMGKDRGKAGDLPVEMVSWNDVQEFILKLNAKTGKQYRLPTEAEWEFAARGGTKSKGYKYSGSNNLDDVAWHRDNCRVKTRFNETRLAEEAGVFNKNGFLTAHPVGTRQANELGIFDMTGNAWEWCEDWYDKYNSSPSTNPRGPSSGSRRVFRGGGWFYPAKFARVTLRSSAPPGFRHITIGFRLACSTE
jgi:formylglycine-generating enzyme required for sulfatase activity